MKKIIMLSVLLSVLLLVILSGCQNIQTEDKLLDKLQQGLTEKNKQCGNLEINEGERCDPVNSICIIETFPEIQMKEGESKIIDNYKIKIIELTEDKVRLQIDETKEELKEKEIKAIKGIGFIQVFKISDNVVRLVFGYSLGQCSEQCRCFPMTEPKAFCGNQNIELSEQCDPPGNECIAQSGLRSICDGDCKCPEPIIGFTWCGDGIIQRPNAMGIWEMCEKPGWRCVGGGICSATCQCPPIPGVPNQCGDWRLGGKEECEPPGALCIKKGLIGTCTGNCKCEVLFEKREDMAGLNMAKFKKMICGTENPECWSIGIECYKNDKKGKCNENCECEIKKIVHDIYPTEKEKEIEYSLFGPVECSNENSAILISNIPCETDKECTADNIMQYCNPGAYLCEGISTEKYCNEDGRPVLTFALPTCGPELYCENNICKIRCVLD